MHRTIAKVINIILPDFLIKRVRYSKYLKNKCLIGANVEILSCSLEQNVRLADYSSVRNCNIDRYTSIGRYSKINHSTLGRFCSVSWDVTIGATNHPTDMLTTHSFPYIKRIGFVKEDKRILDETKLGNDVWVGCNSVILPGLNIGDGAVIGAGSVVTKDVPPYAVIVGIPARIVKYRFSEDIINKLSEVKWWNFPTDTINDNIKLFQKPLDETVISKLIQLKKSL